MSVEKLITDNIDVWTSAIKTKSASGRGSSNKLELYGIKKLRELILELAVRGKLVPQDPSDEPASKLLERIAAEREQLIKSKKIKKQKPLPPISDDDKPFDVPNGWDHCRLGNVIHVSSGKNLTSSKMVKDGGIPVFGGNGITGYHDEANIVEKTLVIGRVGYYCGSIHITPKKAWVTDNAFITYFSKHNIDMDFLALLLKATDLKENENATAQPVISGSKVYPIVVALPPTHEQKRIVAKVDELMVLCDQLESQTETNIEAHQTLVKTLLETLTNAKDADELNESWQRISEHFDVLFTTEASIDQIKQTILQLAVMGKLVKQDPNDEPASKLLERIAAEKEKLIREGKLKKQKKAIAHDAVIKEGNLPHGWVAVDFGDVSFNRDSERVPLSVSQRQNRRGEYDYYGASGVIDSIDDFLFDKPLLLIGEDGANLVNRSTPIAFMARGKYWVNNHAHVIDGITEQLLQYLALYINSISLLPYITGMAQPKMNQAKMNGILVFLPPEGEQCRILAKVDDLMAVCDKLKDRLRDAQTTQLHLTDAIVEQAS
ncbi:hypothetical protein BM528_08085 [Alteromonas sp. RW2A1]|uniref:restriction endonuclease subunit S n=1 Tax=Alteromonas sp. RW2A1 TaxID=1917158 RepID=UPI0009045BED|nr:restriction endonuclease subunit S [Alteromonas sp. RW2A1]APE05734.1 hypothetical protein BM528_08085 [Alteromonas sp. RW2A1]